jgi:ribosomal protein S18 acetylase RimI-like enzyme
MGLIIKLATTDDIATIRSIADVAFRETYREILSPEQMEYMMDWMYSEESLRQQMTADNHTFQIGYDADDKAVGYVSVQPEGESTYHLQKIYLLPEAQGNGYGRQLFGAAVSYIKSIHPAPCTMRLNVNRQNKALDFYRHMGMRQVDEGDFSIGHGYYMNDYIMALDI